jgi:hypothetical protein
VDAHAGPAELPELHEFSARVYVRFRRPEGQEALERYTTGLLTEVPNKNRDTLAQGVSGSSDQRWQEFLTTMPWDEEDLKRQRVQKRTAEATRGAVGLMVDDTGLPTQGKTSVGLECQYSGTLDKRGQCQIAVTCSYSDGQATWPGGSGTRRCYGGSQWIGSSNSAHIGYNKAVLTHRGKKLIIELPEDLHAQRGKLGLLILALTHDRHAEFAHVLGD